MGRCRFDQREKHLKTRNLRGMGKSPGAPFEAVLSQCHRKKHPLFELGERKDIWRPWWTQNAPGPGTIEELFKTAHAVAIVQAGLPDINVRWGNTSPV
jgi:hypothetical protein